MSSQNESRRYSLAATPAGQANGTQQSTHSPSYHGRREDTIRIYDGVRFVVVGSFTPERVFVKRLSPTQILQRPHAIAIQAKAIDVLERRGCQSIRAEIDNGPVLTVSFEVFKHEGFLLDRGYGKQIALPFSCWQQVAGTSHIVEEVEKW